MDLTHWNPWHKSPPDWGSDRDLDRAAQSKLRYHPNPFQIDDCRPDAVLTLRGPRRAGKTIALKLWLRDLAQTHRFDPKRLAWVNFESVTSMDAALGMLREIHARSAPRVLFIDEVTSVPGWRKALKSLKDDGLFHDSTLVLAGSSAHDLKSGAERMAGRRGDVTHPDRTLLPMSFREFLSQLEQAGVEATPEQAFGHYLTVGGFPFRVDGFLRDAGTPYDRHRDFQVFDDIVFYEINRRQLARNVGIEAINRISGIQTTAVSYDGFAKPLSISKDTARRYLDAFGDSFLLSTLYSFDTSRNRVAPKKDKKLAWVDPALGFFAEWLGTGPAAAEPARAEWVVATELLRRNERRLWEGLSAPRNVYTWKSSGGNEVDFLVIDTSRKMRTPYEVKFQNQIVDWDFQVMERAFGCGLILSRNDERRRAKSRSVPIWKWLLSSE